MNELTLRITEIFYSLQGETRTMGLPTAFIRLTGCPLRCGYCDTAYAFSGGQMMSLPTILNQVDGFKPHYVTVTGGEPLAQKNCWPLLVALCDQGYEVSLETSGAIDIASVDPRVVKIIDIKTPASGELGRNLYTNLDCLQPHDQIKFVLCDKADYDWAKEFISNRQLAQKTHILFSPSFKDLPARELADWIVADNLPVRMQIQLHKYLWNDEAGR
ncbi:MAG: 7-carboxy-7-deazaguanine synthase QueE [Gammaproteobacteria bacterium]|nr:7-carboxy-7-deazaguanine synthase QueE [Gammaproteobacteria bacterium]